MTRVAFGSHHSGWIYDSLARQKHRKSINNSKFLSKFLCFSVENATLEVDPTQQRRLLHPMVAFSLQIANLSNLWKISKTWIKCTNSGEFVRKSQWISMHFHGLPWIFVDVHFMGTVASHPVGFQSWLALTDRGLFLQTFQSFTRPCCVKQSRFQELLQFPETAACIFKAWIRAVQCFLGSTQIYQDILWQDLQTDGVIGEKMATSRHMHRCFHKLGSKPWVSLAPPVQSSDQQGPCRLPCTRQVYSKLLLRAKVWFFSVSSSSSSSTSSVCRGIHIHIHSFANDRKVKLY